MKIEGTVFDQMHRKKELFRSGQGQFKHGKKKLKFFQRFLSFEL